LLELAVAVEHQVDQVTDLLVEDQREVMDLMVQKEDNIKDQVVVDQEVQEVLDQVEMVDQV
jgi:hypothetical protein